MNITQDRTVNERVIQLTLTAAEVEQAIVDWAMRDPALKPPLDGKGAVAAKVEFENKEARVTITIDLAAKEVAVDG